MAPDTGRPAGRGRPVQPAAERVGFDYFWGFLGGEAGQWDPVITENNKTIGVPQGTDGKEVLLPRRHGRQDDRVAARGPRRRPGQAVVRVFSPPGARTPRTTCRRSGRPGTRGSSTAAGMCTGNRRSSGRSGWRGPGRREADPSAGQSATSVLIQVRHRRRAPGRVDARRRARATGHPGILPRTRVPPRTPGARSLSPVAISTVILLTSAVAHPDVIRNGGLAPQPVLDGPQCRVPGRAELRLFKPGHPRCPRRCSVVRCGRKLLEPWTTAALATGEPALRSFVTGLRADQDAVTAGSHGHKGAAAAWFGGLPVIGARKHPKRAHLAQTSSARGDAEPVRWLDPEVTRW